MSLHFLWLQVRVMSEPSNMPPLWTSAYVANLARLQDASGLASGNGDTEPNTLKDHSPWETSFAQPASDYLAFRNRLDKNSVSLENVIVREAENCLIGTAKVKNLAYDKDVTIRATFDNWKTFADVPCSYVEQPGMVTVPVVRNLYDTFRFRLPLPANDSGAHQCDFCVRYRSDGQEFWDNNAGSNYVVKKKRDVSIANKADEFATMTGRAP